MIRGLFDQLLGAISTSIGGLARSLRDRVSAFIRRRPKTPTQTELTDVMRTFDGPYLETMATALQEITGERISHDALRRYMIGDVMLSNRLYHQARQTAGAVRRLLEDHARYGHDARKLALDLFEGYGFRDTETLVPRVRLPKYLDDAILNGEMDALLARIQATRLRTDPLRAAYLQALDAVLSGAGQDAIDRALDVAVQERYRYFANRIAQTELARTQNNQVARELLDDASIHVVRHQLSGQHVADMCDVFTYQDAYGLGPGLYPKLAAPKPPHHPFCRCTLSPLIGRTAEQARYNPSAASAYLRMVDARTAAQIAGSKAKREEVLSGGDWENMLNRGRHEAYRIGHVGDLDDQNERED